MIVVFFDGECGLCQRSIQFLYNADKNKKLLFAPLNGATYKQIYGNVPSPLTTVRLYYDGKTFEKSSAILKLCLVLGGIYKVFYLFIIIPIFIRDYIYDQIAFKRSRFTCVLLTKDERFLE